MAPRRKKPQSGYAKMKAAGKKSVMLTLSEADHKTLSSAAFIERRPLAQFIVAVAMKRAYSVIRDNEDFPQPS